MSESILFAVEPNTYLNIWFELPPRQLFYRFSETLTMSNSFRWKILAFWNFLIHRRVIHNNSQCTSQFMHRPLNKWACYTTLFDMITNIRGAKTKFQTFQNNEHCKCWNGSTEPQQLIWLKLIGFYFPAKYASFALPPINFYDPPIMIYW
jgi:hypothetical protein